MCTIARKPSSGRPSKINNFVIQIVEQQIRSNDETSAMQLHELLLQHGIGISLRSVLQGRKALSWTFQGSAYCQLIREPNKQTRFDWAQQHLHNSFDNVIWTDEASIQLEIHRKRCYRMRGELPKPKPRPKHPIKVHVWGGISMQAAT